MSAPESWLEETRSAWLYRQLATVEPEQRVATLFRSLGDEAEKQAQTWAAIAARENAVLPAFQPGTRERLTIGLARRLGPRRVKTMLAALKVRGLSAYDAVVPGHATPMRLEDVGHRHKGFGGGNLRAAIFGANDGLVSNTSLILGVIGASASTEATITAGVAGLLAGALSMAAGEYVSVRSQRELFEYQIELERQELAEYPEAEAAELALIYQARGLSPEEARALANRLTADPKIGLDVLAREELGLNPDELDSPWGAAGFSFASFSIGALIPLIPFFAGGSLPNAGYIGAAMAAVGLFATGASLSLFTGRSALGGGARMLAIGAAAGALTWLIGGLFGAAVG
jgi:VIT1/CCC1 family predicted Fe2+/Mn2+ transporter